MIIKFYECCKNMERITGTEKEDGYGGYKYIPGSELVAKK